MGGEGGEYVVQPVAQALPNAAVALMSGGTSLAGQGAAALGTAANAGSTAAIIGNTAKEMLSNPSFWSSFAQTVGPTYFEAKENGASEIEASATALLNAFAGSAIEVGGGIETLPNTTMGVRQWVRSMLDEGKEEVLQGAMEGLISKAVYDKDREWFSLTDPDAIFSGSRALQEFAGGVTVGGILGGGQIGTAKAVEAIQNYSAAVKVGNVYLKGESGQTLDKAVQIGLSNAKGTDMYRAAEAIQQKAANGEQISPYAVGRMVVDSFTQTAQKARALDTQVRQSAQAFGLDEQAVDDVARIAVAAGRQVEFVAPEQLQVVGANGVSTAEGRYSDGKVQLNAALPAERLTGYLIKHELTHAVENTKEWAQLEQIVRSSYGDAAFEAAKTAVMQRYAANNTQLTPEGATREVVAQWVGDNLFKEGFAQALASGNASVGNAFLQALDKIRLALGGTKNSRTAGNIAMVERLFMRALEGEQGKAKNTATDEQYVIGYTDNNQPVVIISENILDGVPQDQWINAVKDTIKKRFSNGVPVGGRLVKVNKITRDEYTWSRNSQAYSKNDPAIYEDKLKAGGSLDEIILASTNYVNEDLNHSRKDNFTQFARGDVLMRVGGNDYTAKVIIGWTSGNQMVLYDVIDFSPTTLNIKKAGVSSPSSFTQVEQNSSNTSASDTRVPQNSFGVNSYDMQNGGENSQFSFGGVNGTDINVPYEGELTTPPPSDDGTSPDKGRLGDAANSQALGERSLARSSSSFADAKHRGNLDEAAEVEVQGQEIPEGTAGATQTVYQPEAVPSRESERKKAAQGKTLEELEQELSDHELFNRAYMSEVIDRPPQTVEIGGQEVDSAAYMDMVEETIPDTEEGIEAFIADVSQRRADEAVRRYDETGEVSGDTTAADLQLLAADRKLTRIRLSEGETDGKVMRRFFEQRLKNLDANDTHAAEMVEYLAGRDERYNPISNAKTLEKAKERLKDPAYALKLERRIKHHKQGDVMSDVDAAAAQVMINDAKNSGDLELFSDLIQGLSRYGTDLGRAVQILSLQKRLTPEGTIRAAERTMNKAIDAQHGEGASDSIEHVSGTITEAVERAAETNLEGATVEQLEGALGDTIISQKSPYISEEQIRGIIHRAVDSATNIPQHVKKMLQDPAVQKTLAEKIAYIHQQGHLSDGAVCTAMKQALGVPSLNTEDVAHLIQLVDAMQATEEGTLAREDAAEEIYRFLGEKLPTSFMEGLMSWRKFAMLANPKTHIRNFFANMAMMGGVNKLDSAFSTVFQRLFLKDEVKRTAYFGWRSSEHGKQLLQNNEMFEKQTEKALARLRGDEKYEFTDAKLARYKKTFGKNKVGEFFNKLNDKNSDWLEKEDAFSFRYVFKDALGQIMTARGVSEVDADIFEVAYQKAAEAVFRADNAMATVLSQLKQGMYDANTSKGKKALGYIADIVIPFSKTPANIAVSSFQHSPLGYLKSGYDLVQTLRNAPNAKAMADVLNGFAKNTTGTVLWIVGLLLGSLGLFNTGYGKTEKERAADELAGIQENALVIGNTSFTMDWLQPAVSPLIVGASIAQRFREDGLSLSALGGALMDGTDSLFELTMLQSLYDVLGGYDAGASASAASIAENTISQSIPTLLGQAARAIDPVQRKTTGDNDFETVINQIMAKVPGLTYLLEPELDVWGDEVYRTGKASGGTALLNAVQQFLLPSNVKVGTGKGDDLSQAVLKMYNSGADKSSRALPTSVTRDEAKEMGVDYDELFRIVAQTQREKAEELMSDKVSYSVQTEGANGKKRTVQKRWSQMTEDERLRVMNRVYSDVKSSATDPDEAFYDEIIRRLRYGN